MAEPTQYIFSHKEITELMIQKQGITEGNWQLIMQFNLIGGNMGPSPAEAVPGAMMLITNMGLQRTNENGPLVVDASQVVRKSQGAAATSK